MLRSQECSDGKCRSAILRSGEPALLRLSRRRSAGRFGTLEWMRSTRRVAISAHCRVCQVRHVSLPNSTVHTKLRNVAPRRHNPASLTVVPTCADCPHPLVRGLSMGSEGRSAQHETCPLVAMRSARCWGHQGACPVRVAVPSVRRSGGFGESQHKRSVTELGHATLALCQPDPSEAIRRRSALHRAHRETGDESAEEKIKHECHR